MEFNLRRFIQESDYIEGIYNPEGKIAENISQKKGYPYLHYLAFNIILEDPNEDNLLEAHKTFLPHLAYIHKPYRQCEIIIGGRNGTPAKKVRDQMAKLFSREIKTVKDICKFHIDYEQIHPFADGNGRTGRMLLNSQLNKLGRNMITITHERRFEYYSFIEYKEVDKFVEFVNGL